eukprot:Nk52_evm1s2125 gene=Nk52_evmTU1s2125
MRQDKVQDIQQIESPTNVSEVRSALGKIGFYRRFIHRFSDRTLNMTNLLQDDAPFSWSSECENELLGLKQACLQQTKLKNPDYSKPFYVQADASDYALGA